MAAQDSLRAQAAAFPYAVLVDRLVSVFAAGRKEAAAIAGFHKRKETMVKRQGSLIKTDEF